MVDVDRLLHYDDIPSWLFLSSFKKFWKSISNSFAKLSYENLCKFVSSKFDYKIYEVSNLFLNDFVLDKMLLDPVLDEGSFYFF